MTADELNAGTIFKSPRSIALYLVVRSEWMRIEGEDGIDDKWVVCLNSGGGEPTMCRSPRASYWDVERILGKLTLPQGATDE